jgi:hypothetical protein
MGCCKNNNDNNIRADDRSIPEGVDPCCHISGRRCMCLPYDDAWTIAAQILAILAFCVSWIWWATFIANIAALVMFQLPWCCRQNSGSLYGSAAVAFFNALAMIGLGIYVLVVWKDVSDCVPFYGYTYTSSSFYNDYCHEEAWGAIALVCAFLWGAAAVCMFCFVKSGRHALWEKRHIPSDAELAEASPEVVEEGDQPTEVTVEVLGSAKINDV